MTLLGKLLAMLTAVVSVAMMIWSISLYTNRINWSDKKAGPAEPEGELAKRKTRLDQAYKALPAPETTWRDARIDMLVLESRRPGDRKWYGEQLEYLRTGATKANPAVAVVMNAENLPELGADGRPKMAPAK